MILYGRDSDNKDDSATQFPIGTRILSAQQNHASKPGFDDHDYNDETILGWDHRRHGGGLMTDQGDLWGVPTGKRGKPHPALICLLAFCIIVAAYVALRDGGVIANTQKAAGQLVETGFRHVGYRNTAPLSTTAAATVAATPVPPPPLSSSASAIPLQEILTGVPSLSQSTVKESASHVR